MGPAIGRSLKQGLATASRSWAGIGLFAGIWLIVAVIAVGSIAATSPPATLFEAPLPAAPPAAAPPAPTSPAPDATVAPPTVSPATPAAPTVSAAQREAERTRQIDAWFGRAWPLLLVCVLLFLAVNVWLNAGQIGYLAQRVATGQAAVSEFVAAGSRAFGALLAASLLMMLGVGVPLALFGILSVALPPGGRVIMLLLGLIAVVALVWAGVRLLFFAIAIVVDRMGPMAGFKTSFRITRGYWWKIFGLALLLGLLSYLVLLPFAFLEWLGGVLGGMAALILGFFGNLGTLIASLFMGFASLAALIHFYRELRSSPPRPAA